MKYSKFTSYMMYICSTSNIEILERFQSKVLRIIADSSWYVPNTVIRHDLHFYICYVEETQAREYGYDIGHLECKKSV
jgi:hypothetical protein